MREHTDSRRNHEMTALTDARDRLSEIVDDVSTTGSDLVITKHGIPAAVVLGFDEYESLLETLNILSDSDTMAAIDEGDAEIVAGDLTEVE